MVIYTWKILEGLVPNFSTNSSKTTCYWSDRRVPKCRIPSLKHRKCWNEERTIFLSVKGPRLFNTLPSYLGNCAAKTLAVFKSHLEKFLKAIPDEPDLPGYAQTRVARTNTAVYQVRYSRAWAMPGPQEQIQQRNHHKVSKRYCSYDSHLKD